MNAHIKSKHQGLRWICEIDDCDQACTTKASLRRHIARAHLPPINSILRNLPDSQAVASSHDLKEKEYFDEGELTDGAKMAKIRRLESELKTKDTIIEALTKSYERLKEENEILKATIDNQPTPEIECTTPND